LTYENFGELPSSFFQLDFLLELFSNIIDKAGRFTSSFGFISLGRPDQGAWAGSLIFSYEGER
jgi:hypothetical protein